MDKVKDLIKDIRENLSQTSSSQKDELKVMRAMLNDREFTVDVYGADGVNSTYCPSADAREMCSNIISATTKVSKEESTNLMDKYEFKKSDASTMINLSKEFVNTFIQTGRKMPLGGRENSNVSLSLKEVSESTRTYPKKTGVDASGNAVYENVPTIIKAHESVRVHAPCPSWKK